MRGDLEGEERNEGEKDGKESSEGFEEVHLDRFLYILISYP